MTRFLVYLLGMMAALASAPVGWSQAGSPWRFWDSGDGFSESYASGVAPNPNGSLWVKHGATGRLDLVDGYGTSKYPDPGGTGKIEAAPDGTLWLWCAGQLKVFRGDHWAGYDVEAVTASGTLRSNSFDVWEITPKKPQLRATRLNVVGLDRRRALILLPDRILEFDTEGARTRVALTAKGTRLNRFAGIYQASPGVIYVSGHGGVGRLLLAEGRQWRWEELRPPPAVYSDFEEPFARGSSDVFVTGVTGMLATGVLHFDGHRWTELYRGESRQLRAWPGGSGSVWIQDGNHVMELADGQRHVAERNGALSGILLSVMPEGSDRFWISTSQGLAHYMPQLWQTPPGIPQTDDVVNAITEDRVGRVWFLAAHKLLCLDGATWTAISLPKEEVPWAIFTEGLAVLPGGELAIRTTAPHLLVYDPAKRRFRVVQHPEGRTMRMFVAGPKGDLLVETLSPGSDHDLRVDSFDGSKFRQFIANPALSGAPQLRSLRVGPDGSVWAGGTDFFGVYRDSKFLRVGKQEGFGDGGAYMIHIDPKGVVIAGGRDGLYRLEGTRWLRMETGFDRVRSILTARDGSVWVASGTGLHRYRPGVRISNGLEEGLPSSVAYKVFEDSHGRIWAGTTRGLSLFHPEADPDPPIAYLAADRNPSEAPPGGNVQLVFSGTDKWKFTLPGRLLFSYRMDGGGWSVFGPADFASFERLPAGQHRFEVRVMDRNGNISKVPAVHIFSVLLPWYSTPGFRGIAAVCGALIAILISLAVLSYSHRGKLIRELNRKNKVERDRQAILEMVAAREPLPAILKRIATCVADSCKPAGCVIVFDSEHGFEVYPAPAVPASLEGPLDDFCRLKAQKEECWRVLESILRDHFRGTYEIGAVRAGASESTGAIVLLLPVAQKVSRGSGSLETFSALAAAAVENARLYERMAYQAKHDVLTGLPNRLYFDSRLELSVHDARSRGSRLAVVYLDLDRFKQINDTLGHRVGDLFLREVGMRLAGTLRSGETLARIGGDEFTILIEHNVNEAYVRGLARGLLSALRSPIEIEGQELFASASIGVSFFPEDGDNPSTIQKHADTAMYRAKATGKNRVELFDAEMLLKAKTAMSLEQILRKAVDEQLFELYYQPQFTPKGTLAGFEALLRLKHPDAAHISPAEFIPVAEDIGLIVPIGAWVLRTACRQMREWMNEGIGGMKIAIKVSSLQISKASFADEVIQVLRETGLPPESLELELTETAIVSSFSESTKQMERLRGRGVRMVLDDFGTGYSSLSSLRRLPVDALKIGQSFIQGITCDSGGSEFVRAIVALARSVGLQVVAEGIETDSQLALLRENGCDLLQGHLFSRPRPAEELGALFERFEAVQEATETISSY